MIYVHERFDVSSPINILELVNGWEYVCIEILQWIPFSQIFIIANIYRPLCKILETFTTFLREFHPKITLPIRITDTSNTLVDNILTSVYNDNHVSRILIKKILDH